MNLRQAAQQALDWLEDDAATTVDEAYTKERQIADALRAALAEHDRLAGIEAIEKTAGIHVSQQAEPDSDYERGFVDGMNLQTKGSVDKAVNRIAEPKQEPVAWLWQHRETGRTRVLMPDERTATDVAAAWDVVGPLYLTAPTPRKPLTVFEIDAIAEHLDKTTIGWATHEFAAAIEKAHGIGEQHE